MQFKFFSAFLFVISCMIILVSATPIPVPVPSAADSLVVARLPEPVDSPLTSSDAEARTVDFIGDTPLAPLDAEARSLSEPKRELPDVGTRTPEPENDVMAPEAEERGGCGRWACI
ncbi:hypothetical protein GYMLUDRAFT_37697 [Collybiopsis luxurians FD-317 M1]|nr:hypothetical protein GYMLUDRAFT_37697 [Collybiopsis luxurians FD-317 M1]